MQGEGRSSSPAPRLSWGDMALGSSADRDGSIAVVDLHRGHWVVVAEGAVRAVVIVEADEAFEVGVGLDLGLVAFEIDLIVFDGPPEPLDEDVVEAAPLSIHREFHAKGEQWLGKFGRGELAALVGVEDLRHSVLLDRPLDRPGAEAGVEGVRQFPSQDRPAVPIDHREEVDVATLDRNVGDVVYAARGITDIMPGAGLCRVVVWSSSEEAVVYAA